MARARPYAEAARAIVDDLGPGAQPWEVYGLLQRIAAAEGDERGAARWRVRAQHIFARSPAAQTVRDQWRPLIESVAKTGRGAALELETVQAVEELGASPQWQALAATVWRILDGQRGPELYEALDHVDAAIVRAILEAIESPEAEEAQGAEQDPATSP
jgi:hypothetical protein